MISPGPDLRLIAAVGRHGQIGLDGELPWHDPADFAFFKKMTAGGVVVVGRRTFPAVQHLNHTENRIFLVDGEAVYDPKTQDMESWDFWAPFRIAGNTRTVWIAGGLNTYCKWIEMARLRDILMPWVISPLAYDGPADTYMPLPWAPLAQVAGVQPLRLRRPEQILEEFWETWDKSTQPGDGGRK